MTTIIFYDNKYIEESFEKIKELYRTDKLTSNLDIYANNEFNLGVYYYYIEENYDLAKKYYLMAIDKDNSYAMNNLGVIYHIIEKNYDLAKKYYLMAIDKGNSEAMNGLGIIYHIIEENYDLAKKYYLMAIDKDNSKAMNNLGYYYHFIEKNYDLVKEYYLMAIDKGYSLAMNNLGVYYDNIKKNYELAKKYYMMAIDKGHLNAMNNIKQITTILERYVLFKKNNIKFEEEINKDIHIFNNKIKNYSIKEECKFVIMSMNAFHYHVFIIEHVLTVIFKLMINHVLFVDYKINNIYNNYLYMYHYFFYIFILCKLFNNYQTIIK